MTFHHRHPGEQNRIQTFPRQHIHSFRLFKCAVRQRHSQYQSHLYLQLRTNPQKFDCTTEEEHPWKELHIDYISRGACCSALMRAFWLHNTLPYCQLHHSALSKNSKWSTLSGAIHLKQMQPEQFSVTYEKAVIAKWCTNPTFPSHQLFHISTLSKKYFWKPHNLGPPFLYRCSTQHYLAAPSLPQYAHWRISITWNYLGARFPQGWFLPCKWKCINCSANLEHCTCICT